MSSPSSNHPYNVFISGFQVDSSYFWSLRRRRHTCGSWTRGSRCPTLTPEQKQYLPSSRILPDELLGMTHWFAGDARANPKQVGT